MKKICIICPWGYPVPAVKGGAVETLMQFLIEENEIDPCFEITLLTTADTEAEKIAQKYVYTKYIGYKYHENLDKCWDFVFRAIKKLLKRYIPSSFEMMQVFGYLKKNAKAFDYVLLECGSSYMIPQLANIVSKEKVLAHLHWTGDGNPRIDSGVGNVLAVSGFVANEWMNASQCNRKKVYVWNNCYNDSAFQRSLSIEEAQSLKRSLGIENKRVVIYTGRIIEGKGILELIQAFNNLAMDDVALLLIGKAFFGKSGRTPFENVVQQKVEESSKTIVNIGYVNNDELYRYYSISSLMVAPSKLKEAAPLVIIEAMASGTPVISTNIGGIPEYVGDAGVLVEVNEDMVSNLSREMERLLANPKLLEEYSQRSKERAKQFTKRKFFERFLAIINDIESSR